MAAQGPSFMREGNRHHLLEITAISVRYSVRANRWLTQAAASDLAREDRGAQLLAQLYVKVILEGCPPIVDAVPRGPSMLRTLVRSLALVAILSGTALAAGDPAADTTGKVESQKKAKKKSVRKAKKKAARKHHKKKAKKAAKAAKTAKTARSEAPTERRPMP